MKRIYVLMGASGSGKTTLGNFLKIFGIPELVSHTTRKMREGEVPGETYYFVSKEEFDTIRKIEYTEYSGNFYCLSKAEVDNKLSKFGRVFAITDVNGMAQLKAQYPDMVKVIYVHIPLLEMESRMRARGDSEENIKKRLQYVEASGEFQNYVHADYVIENNVLEDSKKRLLEIVSAENNEIERKFLVRTLPSFKPYQRKEIVQGYVSFEPEQRIRSEEGHFYLTEKSDGDLVRKETQDEITEGEFRYYSTFVLGAFVEKDRHIVLMGNHLAEVDTYHKALDGLLTVEVEFLSEKESSAFVPPSWFGEEVTYDKRYKNKNLARYGLPR